MTDEKQKDKGKKVQYSLNYSRVTFFAGVITFLVGVSKRLYLQEYYKYFDIDPKYVSIKLFLNFNDLLSCLLFFGLIFFCGSFAHPRVVSFFSRRNYLKTIKDMYPEVHNYYKRVFIRNTITDFLVVTPIIFLMSLNMCAFYSFEPISLLDLKDYLFSAVTITVLTYLIVVKRVSDDMISEKAESNKTVKYGSKTKKIYKKIFPNNKDKKFMNRQMEAITDYYTISETKENDPLNSFIDNLAAVFFFVVFIMWVVMGFGKSDAREQRTFLVTEDNKHIALPVSENRYALIDIKEEDDCVILITGKQNFHESNDFPCTRKTFREVKIEESE